MVRLCDYIKLLKNDILKEIQSFYDDWDIQSFNKHEEKIDITSNFTSTLINFLENQLNNKNIKAIFIIGNVKGITYPIVRFNNEECSVIIEPIYFITSEDRSQKVKKENIIFKKENIIIKCNDINWRNLRF